MTEENKVTHLIEILEQEVLDYYNAYVLKSEEVSPWDAFQMGVVLGSLAMLKKDLEKARLQK